MKPQEDAVLDDFSTLLAETIAPQLSGFHAGNAAMIAAMMKMLAEHWDTAAASLVEENRAIRDVLACAVRTLGMSQWQSLCDGQDDDIRVSALRASNDQLRNALIRLQAEIEENSDPKARYINQLIWDELRASVKRRHISSANY